MTIYVDIVLAENLCMNYIILLATGYIIKLKVNHLRLLCSSTIGAIYTILAYEQIFPLYTNFTVKIILSICMVYIAFKPNSVKGMAKELIMFYLVSFALGGCAFALLYLVKPQDIFMKDGVYIGTYPIKIALLGGIVGFVIVYTAFRIIKNKMNKSELIYNISIKINEKELTTKVMLDTGNMLKDPISQNPVVLIEKEVLTEVLPNELLKNLDYILGGDLKIQDEIPEEYRTKLRIIPFTSVGKQNGMILGIKTDEIKVQSDVEEVINKNAIVGIYNRKFSKNNKYFGLMGLELLEGSEKNEYITNAQRQH